MKLTPPKRITFWISVVFAAVGLLVQMGTLTFIGKGDAFWCVFVGFVLLVLGLLVKGL
jgi:hypothetical protein